MKAALSKNIIVLGKYYANGKTKSEEKSTTKTSGSGVTIEVPIYEISINEDKGIAYVSADSRYKGVIVYIPELPKNETEEQIYSKELLLSISERTVYNTVEKVEILKDSLRQLTLEKISKELSIPIQEIDINSLLATIEIEGKPITKAQPIENPLGVLVGRLGPLVPVEWNQNYPYNAKYPEEPNFPLWQYIRVPVGCGVILLAQALATFEPEMYVNGNLMDWAYLKERPKIHANGGTQLPYPPYENNYDPSVLDNFIIH